MKKIIEFLIKQVKLLNLIIIFIILAGVNFFINGQKEAFPGFIVNEIYIRTLYPGASAETIEDQVTYPIEESIQNLTGIDKVESSSKESLSTIVAVIDPDYEDRLNDIKNDIQNQIDMIDFPEGTEDPQIEIFDEGFIPVVRVLVAGGEDEWQIRNVARFLERDLKEIKGVGNVRLEGYRKEEIKVACDPYKLKEYIISINEIMDAIRKKNINIPGGEIYRDKKEYLVRVRGFFSTVKEIENIVVRANPDYIAVRVKDVARVYRDFEKATLYKRANGKKGIELAALKNRKGDTIKISDSVNEKLKQYKKRYPGVDFVVFNDTAIYVKNRLEVLGNNAFMGLVFLVIVLLIFFDLRTSFWTVLGMPVAFCAAMIASQFMGITLNLMSMFGFIIVIGMIVDDAIVIAENIYQKMESRLNPLRSAVEGTTEVILPVFVSISTTIAAFLPLLFISGIIGKFFGVIPKVVTLTLIASFAEAIFVLPGHLYHTRLKGDTRKTEIFQSLKSRYEKILTFLMKNRFKTVGIFFAGAVLIMVLLGTGIPFQFSPGRVNEYSIKIEARADTMLDSTEEIVKKVEQFIMQYKDTVQDVICSIGQVGQGRFIDVSENKAGMQIILNPDRPSSFNEIEFKNRIKQFGKSLEGVKNFEVQTLQAGPPPQKAIKVIVSGDSFEQVYETALKIKEYTAGLKNTEDVRLDYDRGKKEYVVDVDEVRAAASRLSPLEIALAVKYAFDGGVATSIKEKGEEIDVRVQYDAVTGATYRTLQYLKIKNRDGYKVSFLNVASIKKEESIFEIRHYNSRITITLLGNLANTYDKKYTSTFINRMIKKKYGDLSEKYPSVRIQYGGENEEVMESIQDIKTAYLVAFLIITVLLIGLFKNYAQIFIILLTIPFGLLGVLVGLFVSNMAFSYTSLIGIVALTGVVVNDAIIMIDIINRKRKEKKTKDIKKSIVEGACSRLRPVILTTLTTMVGLIPMAYGFGGKEEFLQPLGVSIVWGILFSTVLTLGLVPVLYSIIEITVKDRVRAWKDHLVLKIKNILLKVRKKR